MEMRGFGSRAGGVFCVAALGVGGFWQFPAAAARYGGAFLPLYLLMVLLVGIPGLILELTLGRSARRAPVTGMQRLERTKPTPWSAIGVLGCIAAFLTAGVALTVSGGWALGYGVQAIGGTLAGQDRTALAQSLSTFSGGALYLGLAAVEAVLLWLCLHAGVQKGVERAHKILLPTLLVLLLALAVYANTLEGSSAGLEQLLLPDIRAVSGGTVAAAAGYALATIGVGRCCAFVYGSCLRPESSAVATAVAASALSAGAAVLAGLICLPALSAFNLEAEAGPSLLYLTLPRLWDAMGGFGRAFGALFLLAVAMAGFLAVLSSGEALVRSLTDATRLPRRWACVVVTAALFFFSVLVSVLSGTTGRFSLLGLEVPALLGLLSGVCLGVGALLMALYCLIRWGPRKLQREVNDTAGRLRLRHWMLPYFCGVFLAVLLIAIYGMLRGYFG